MSQPRFISMISLCLTLFLFHTCTGLPFVDLNFHEVDVMTKRVCTKSIGECLSLTEPEMDSETNRRVLAMQKKYISYDTLKRDMVPCDRAGASYYNCHAIRANPYNRGCEHQVGQPVGNVASSTAFELSDKDKFLGFGGRIPGSTKIEASSILV
ncbi:hypothetical protein JHK85_049566 [Glycine max]|nr:hypothetical protein JHK85_049566 [Glycine max]